MQLLVATGAKETLDQMMTVQLVLERREMQDNGTTGVKRRYRTNGIDGINGTAQVKGTTGWKWY
jgi:hypothetical protein